MLSTIFSPNTFVNFSLEQSTQAFIYFEVNALKTTTFFVFITFGKKAEKLRLALSLIMTAFLLLTLAFRTF